MHTPTRSMRASSSAIGSSTSRYSLASPLSASRCGSCSAIGSSAPVIAPAHCDARSTSTPSRLTLPRPASVARAGSFMPASRSTTASPGSASTVGSSRNAASIVSSTTPATAMPRSASARVTVLASWHTFSTAASASIA